MIQGRRPVEINPRWRLYRYEPGFGLDRHQDRSFKASGADAAGELRYDVRRDGSESLLTLLIYLGCIVALSSPQMLDAAFDIHFMLSVQFAWRVAAITAASTAPIWLGKIVSHYCAPQVVTKLA